MGDLASPARRAGAAMAAALCVLAASCTAPEALPPAYPTALAPGDFPFRFAVLGNTAAAPDRDRLQALLFARLLNDGPAFVLHTGNLVRDGSLHAHWETFDALTAGLRDGAVPLFPARGFLDLGGGNPEAARHWGLRFSPASRRTWFDVRVKNVLIVVLDSNLEALGPNRREQAEWLENTLRDADLEAGVNFVFVLLHHGAFSNAAVNVSPAQQRELFSPIEKSAKARVVLHAGGGTYERIERDGTWWISTAGGGGMRVSVDVDPATRPFVDAFEGPARRPFHYLCVTVGPVGFAIEAVALDDAGLAFSTVDLLAVGELGDGR